SPKVFVEIRLARQGKDSVKVPAFSDRLLLSQKCGRHGMADARRSADDTILALRRADRDCARRLTTNCQDSMGLVMNIHALNDVTRWPSPDSYCNARPFPHAVIDGFLRPEIAAELAAAFPAPTSECWYRYANPLERKLACNVPGKVPSKIWGMLRMFNSAKC